MFKWCKVKFRTPLARNHVEKRKEKKEIGSSDPKECFLAGQSKIKIILDGKTWPKVPA